MKCAVKLAVLAVCLGSLCACAPVLHRKGEWSTKGGDQFEFEDRHLRFRFSFTDQRFDWHFHNKASSTLVLDHREMYLEVEGDTVFYSLWGAPKAESRELPPFTIIPGGFLAIGYPVRFSSEMVPFPTVKGKQVSFHFTAHWGERVMPYTLRFSKSSPIADVR